MILKLLFTLFLLLLIPVYWKNYGAENFLWFSDIGLFLTFFGLWFKSPLMISMAAIGVLPFEILWGFDFFLNLLFKVQTLGITDYMFDAKYSKFLRGLSLFHLITPFIWFWFLIKWGYDARAWQYQTIVLVIVLLLTYFFTDPTKNINWVFYPDKLQWDWISPSNWLILLLLGIPTLIMFPLHLLFKKIF